MKFTVLTTALSTPLRSPLSSCEASALRCIRQWVHFALTATPCTYVRSPPKRPKITRAPSVQKPTRSFHLRLFSGKKLFVLQTIHAHYNLLKWFTKEQIFNDIVITIDKAYITNQISIFITGTGCCLI